MLIDIMKWNAMRDHNHLYHSRLVLSDSRRFDLSAESICFENLKGLFCLFIQPSIDFMTYIVLYILGFRN